MPWSARRLLHPSRNAAISSWCMHSATSIYSSSMLVLSQPCALYAAGRSNFFSALIRGLARWSAMAYFLSIHLMHLLKEGGEIVQIILIAVLSGLRNLGSTCRLFLSHPCKLVNALTLCLIPYLSFAIVIASMHTAFKDFFCFLRSRYRASRIHLRSLMIVSWS